MKQITTNQEQKSQVRSVLLLTDGQVNRGVTVTSDIIEEIKKLQEKTFRSELLFSTLREQSLTRSLRISPQEQPLEEATASALPSTKNVSTLVHVKHDETEELEDSLHNNKSALKMVMQGHIFYAVCAGSQIICMGRQMCKNTSACRVLAILVSVRVRR